MEKGSYILVLHLEHAIAELQIGKLGRFDFPAGYYMYVGSAFGPGGLVARLRHHERQEKARPHWHIDYLRAHAHLCAIWTVSCPTRLEALWSTRLANEPDVHLPAPGFGASDSSCRSHLFYFSTMPRSTQISEVILSESMATRTVDIRIEVHSFV